MRTGTETLAEFATKLRWEDIPAEVRENVKLRILDVIGLCLAANPAEFFQTVLGAAKTMGGIPVSAVIGEGSRFSPSTTAFVNGTAAHGLDFDDTHSRAIVHASACIVPVALAVAEAGRLSGRDLITAAVAGYETILRLGAAAAGKFHARGFHATAITGTFASALVAGKLQGFNSGQVVNAMGIAGSQASGILEFLEDGSWVKRIHPGWAGMSGIIAAELARWGMTGPKTVLEGRFGLYRTHVGQDEYDTGVLSNGLGSKWETLDICFKPYPACHFIHAFLDCVAALRQEHRVMVEDVTEIVCRVPEGIVPFVCEPVAAKLAPRSDYDGKFSLQFSVASMLVAGRVNVDTYEPAGIADERILDLARQVRYEIDPETTFPQFFPGEVILNLCDGHSLSHKVLFNRGGPGNPLPAADIVAKFRDNAGRVLPADRIETILAAVNHLDGMDDVGDLTALLTVSK